MDFVVGDVVRHTFGFANPNHAAAAICALFPFCWGWHGAHTSSDRLRGSLRSGDTGDRALPLRVMLQWAGRIAGVALCAMLAMTYSRTGMAVLGIEAGALWLLQSRSSFSTQRRRGAECAEDALELTRCARTSESLTQKLKHSNTQTLFLGSLSVLAVMFLTLWWMWPRLALDGAVMNRPKIWLAGLRLFAANPMGVGFGNSGEIASAFMLPDGVAVRTLVNSHLTLLAEMGVLVGGAWIVFIALALCIGRKLRRTWVAFAGLAVSAFSASVFDWHVLFDFAEKGGYGAVNFVLAWGLFAAFAAMGAGCVWGGLVLTQRRRDAECAESFWRMASAKAVLAVVCVAVALCAAGLCFRSNETPRVERGYVAVGNDGLCVYRDGEWSLEAVAKRFPDGARFCIRPGVPEDAEDSGDVWFFGDAAESAWRFKDAKLTLVDPPEFCEMPTNAVVVWCLVQRCK